MINKIMFCSDCYKQAEDEIWNKDSWGIFFKEKKNPIHRISMLNQHCMAAGHGAESDALIQHLWSLPKFSPCSVFMIISYLTCCLLRPAMITTDQKALLSYCKITKAELLGEAAVLKWRRSMQCHCFSKVANLLLNFLATVPSYEVLIQ